jgi:hypothetical protein
MYVKRPVLFICIGLITIPVSILVTLLQTGIVSASTFLGLSPSGEGGGGRAWIVLAIGTILSLLGLTFVQAAAARAMAEIDAGRDVNVIDAYRLVFDAIKPLFLAFLVAVPLVSVLTISVFPIPVALVAAVRWALIAPASSSNPRAVSMPSGEAASWCGASGSRCSLSSCSRPVSFSFPGPCSAASSYSARARRSPSSTPSPASCTRLRYRS